MQLAIIDLGTNSVRFDVHLVRSKGTPRLLHREKVMVRLGDGVYQTGKLDEAAAARTIEAFKGFRKIIDKLKVERTIAVGTSALRDAKDGAAFATRVKNETGIDLRIISGAEEAQLIALGVLTHEEPPRGFFALVDIGGGSTEISLCRGTEVVSSLSFRLGTARLTQMFLKTVPPKRARADAPHPIEQLRQHIRETLAAEPVCRIWPKTKLIVGSSGTIRSLIRLKKALGKKGGKSINRETLRKLVKQMSSMTMDELLAMPGMSARRVDMILGGGILLEEVMDFAGAKKVAITEFSLRDGLMENEVRDSRGEKTVQSQSKSEIATARLNLNVAHRLTLCEAIFSEMRPVHGLRTAWLNYAKAALLAEAILPQKRSRSSRWEKEFGKTFGWFESWERKFIARLMLRRTISLGRTRSVDERKRALVALSTILLLCDQLGSTRREITRRVPTRLQGAVKEKARVVPQLRIVSNRARA